MGEDFPSDGSDNLKLILAALIFVGLCLTMVGVIPVFILMVGAYLSYRSGDFSNVRFSTNFIKFLCLAASFVFIILYIYHAQQISSIESSGGYAGTEKSMRNDFAIISMIALASALILQYLWLLPLERQLPKLRSRRVETREPDRTADGPSIMAREALAPYSTADELLKWSRLRDEGLITDEEFGEARNKILKGG